MSGVTTEYHTEVQYGGMGFVGAQVTDKCPGRVSKYQASQEWRVEYANRVSSGREGGETTTPQGVPVQLSLMFRIRGGSHPAGNFQAGAPCCAARGSGAARLPGPEKAGWTNAGNCSHGETTR